MSTNCTCRVERRSSSAPTHSDCVNDDRRPPQLNTYAHLRAHIITRHIVRCGQRPRPLSRSLPRLRGLNPNTPKGMCACSPLSRRRVQRFFAGMARVQEGKSRVRENRKKAWVTWAVGSKSDGNQTSLPSHIIKIPLPFFPPPSGHRSFTPRFPPRAHFFPSSLFERATQNAKKEPPSTAIARGVNTRARPTRLLGAFGLKQTSTSARDKNTGE